MNKVYTKHYKTFRGFLGFKRACSLLIEIESVFVRHMLKQKRYFFHSGHSDKRDMDKRECTVSCKFLLMTSEIIALKN